MCQNISYFKTYFANFLSQYDETSYLSHRERKTGLFRDLKGEVLEVGPGTGVNFRFLNNSKINWTGLEPNPAMHPFLLQAAQNSNVQPRLLKDKTEHITLPDNSFDYVISTEVLCSVNDIVKSIREIRRVLKPGGKFLFLEHVVDRNNLMRRSIQKIVPFTPWKFYSDGCRPGRDIGKIINEGGFSKVTISNYMQPGDGFIQMINRPHIIGTAIK